MDTPEKKKIAAQTVIALQHTGAHDEIGSVYHELHRWAKKNGVKIAGAGFTTFLSAPNEYDASSALYEVCLPVTGGPKGDGQVKVKNVPAMTVAVSRVKGPYDRIPAHYTEMLAWLSSEGWEIAGSPREVYIKHPVSGDAGDPDEFITEIQFPLKA